MSNIALTNNLKLESMTMIEVMINGSSFRVKHLLAELESGEELSISSPVISGMVYTPPIMVESTPAPTLTVEPKPKKTRKPRAKKATPVAVVETPVVDAAIAAEAATDMAPATRKRGGKRRSSKHISIPLYECQSTATYVKKDGTTMAVAVWKSGVRGKSQTKWYILLFISKDLTTAYHNDGGFYADPKKLDNITMIG